MGDLGATNDDHLRLIGKRVRDFLLVLFELLSLSITAEALQAIIGSKSATSLQRVPVDPKFRVEGVAPHQPFFFSENRLNGLLQGKLIKIHGQIFLRFCHNARV